MMLDLARRAVIALELSALAAGLARVVETMPPKGRALVESAIAARLQEVVGVGGVAPADLEAKLADERAVHDVAREMLRAATAEADALRSTAAESVAHASKLAAELDAARARIADLEALLASATEPEPADMPAVSAR